jgi:hypothetical protein
MAWSREPVIGFIERFCELLVIMNISPDDFEGAY